MKEIVNSGFGGMGTQAVQFHTHNGIDSPIISATTSGTIYKGIVTTNAAGAFFPTGWTISKITTGNYKITHKLGTSVYVALFTPISNGVIWQLNGVGITSFNVNFFTPGLAAADSDFYFAVLT